MKKGNDEIMKTPEKIAHKFVHGLNDALTDSQEEKDLAKEIQEYAHEYHQRQLKKYVDIVFMSVIMYVCYLMIFLICSGVGLFFGFLVFTPS